MIKVLINTALAAITVALAVCIGLFIAVHIPIKPPNKELLQPRPIHVWRECSREGVIYLIDRNRGPILWFCEGRIQ